MTNKQPEALQLAELLSETENPSCALREAIVGCLRYLYWEESRVREHRDVLLDEINKLHEVSKP